MWDDSELDNKPNVGMWNLLEICMNVQDPDAPPMDGVYLLRADSVIRFRPPSMHSVFRA